MVDTVLIQCVLACLPKRTCCQATGTGLAWWIYKLCMGDMPNFNKVQISPPWAATTAAGTQAPQSTQVRGCVGKICTDLLKEGTHSSGTKADVIGRSRSSKVWGSGAWCKQVTYGMQEQHWFPQVAMHLCWEWVGKEMVPASSFVPKGVFL